MPNLAQRRWVLSLAPVAHYPTATQVFRSLLESHDIRVVGLTTVDGRAAIKLAGPRLDRRLPSDGGANAGVEVWVEQKTSVPIKEVNDRLPLFETIETWIEYKTLPITTVDERLVSLVARHPHARVDRDRNDYLRAANGDVPFPGLEPRTAIEHAHPSSGADKRCSVANPAAPPRLPVWARWSDVVGRSKRELERSG